MGLIILSGICDIVIFFQGLGVPSPFCIHIHDRLTGFCLLCGNHDDSIGTACTIEGIGCSILEDSHRLYVARVDVVKVS